MKLEYILYSGVRVIHTRVILKKFVSRKVSRREVGVRDLQRGYVGIYEVADFGRVALHQ